MDFARAEVFRQDNFSIQHVDTFVHLSTHIGAKDIKFTCCTKRVLKDSIKLVKKGLCKG